MMSELYRLSDYRKTAKRVFFTRSELAQLIAIYSRRVALGEWRDYAIDHRLGAAIFSVFRHTLETPQFAIAKFVLPGKAPEYALFSGSSKLKKSAALSDVLAALERRLTLVSSR